MFPHTFTWRKKQQQKKNPIDVQFISSEQFFYHVWCCCCCSSSFFFCLLLFSSSTCLYVALLDFPGRFVVAMYNLILRLFPAIILYLLFLFFFCCSLIAIATVFICVIQLLYKVLYQCPQCLRTRFAIQFNYHGE